MIPAKFILTVVGTYAVFAILVPALVSLLVVWSTK
jgi:hypothetical protein